MEQNTDAATEHATPQDSNAANKVFGETRPKAPTVDQPSEEEFDEVVTPDLSNEVFVIADKPFKIRVSNIKTQKVMAKALGAIGSLVQKIDIESIVSSFKSAVMCGEEGEGSYLDVVRVIRDIISHGGLDNIMITIMDLYVGVVYAICNSQDSSIEIEWIEDNINLRQAQDIFFRQMKKDKIQSRILDFLAVATNVVVAKTR
jgi:exosome complex RNA-binding protein Csl4